MRAEGVDAGGIVYISGRKRGDLRGTATGLEVLPLKELAFAFLGRDSAIPEQAWMALAAPSVLVYGSAVVHGMGYQ